MRNKKMNLKTSINIVFRDEIENYSGVFIDNYLNYKNEVLEFCACIRMPKTFNTLYAITSLCLQEVRYVFLSDQIQTNELNDYT